MSDTSSPRTSSPSPDSDFGQSASPPEFERIISWKRSRPESMENIPLDNIFDKEMMDEFDGIFGDEDFEDNDDIISTDHHQTPPPVSLREDSTSDLQGLADLRVQETPPAQSRKPGVKVNTPVDETELEGMLHDLLQAENQQNGNGLLQIIEEMQGIPPTHLVPPILHNLDSIDEESPQYSSSLLVDVEDLMGDDFSSEFPLDIDDPTASYSSRSGSNYTGQTAHSGSTFTQLGAPPTVDDLERGQQASRAVPAGKKPIAVGGKKGNPTGSIIRVVSPPRLHKSKSSRCSWSEQEDEVILKAVMQRGYKWTEIAQLLNNRSGNAVRNRFHRLTGSDCAASLGGGDKVACTNQFPSQVSKAAQQQRAAAAAAKAKAKTDADGSGHSCDSNTSLIAGSVAGGAAAAAATTVVVSTTTIPVKATAMLNQDATVSHAATAVSGITTEKERQSAAASQHNSAKRTCCSAAHREVGVVTATGLMQGADTDEERTAAHAAGCGPLPIMTQQQPAASMSMAEGAITPHLLQAASHLPSSREGQGQLILQQQQSTAHVVATPVGSFQQAAQHGGGSIADDLTQQPLTGAVGLAPSYVRRSASDGGAVAPASHKQQLSQNQADAVRQAIVRSLPPNSSTPPAASQATTATTQQPVVVGTTIAAPVIVKSMSTGTPAAAGFSAPAPPAIVKSQSMVATAPTRQKVARISWTPLEDRIIMSEVQKRGFRWTQIANQLHNRTDDAVRNRWHRIQKHAAIHNHALPPTQPITPTSNDAGFGNPNSTSNSNNNINSNAVSMNVAMLHKEKLSIAG